MIEGAYIAAHPEPRPSRPEAIRRLLVEALGKPAVHGVGSSGLVVVSRVVVLPPITLKCRRS